MDRLLQIGFELAGHWHLSDGGLAFELARYRHQNNILYAFVSNGEVKYVGKTTQSLAKRMQGYKNPGATQSTNIKNNANIIELLELDETVDIFALPDGGLIHYGPFHLNLAAALENSIISVLQPPWNGASRRTDKKTLVDEDESYPLETIEIVVHSTYYNSGFFNVPIEFADAFGNDGQNIEIHCGNLPEPFMGYINRRANANGSPRIMGGVKLRDWFQKHVQIKQSVSVRVDSPDSIRIEK
jgi:hypothetical protein